MKKSTPRARERVLPRAAAPALLLLGLASCVHARATEQASPTAPQPVFLQSSSGTISLEEAAALASRHRFVVMGEAHDSPCDHHAQRDLIDAIARRGGRPAVGLESVSVEKQEVLDRFHDGDLPLDELEEALEWSSSWGFPFALVRPIFETAKRWNLPVAALNLPKELTRAVGREGIPGLSPGDRSLLPRIVPPPAEQEAMLREVWEAHGAQVGRGFDRFVLVQSLWDSQMAAEAIRWSGEQDRQVVVLAGAGHVQYGWGIPHRLRTLLQGATVLTLLPLRGEGPAAPSESDLFFSCPRMQPGRGDASLGGDGGNAPQPGGIDGPFSNPPTDSDWKEIPTLRSPGGVGSGSRLLCLLDRDASHAGAGTTAGGRGAGAHRGGDRPGLREVDRRGEPGAHCPRRSP